MVLGGECDDSGILVGQYNQGKKNSLARMGSVSAGKECGRPRLLRAGNFQLGDSDKDSGKNSQRTGITVGPHLQGIILP